MMPLALVANTFVFVLGTAFGSFFNVCIHRLPREESIAWPASRCPSCRKPILWRDNIPLVSFLILRGRCRQCGAGISPRYFVVELVSGLFFLWSWLYFGFTARALEAAVLFSLLMVATVVDLEHQIIPDEVSVGGLCFGLLLSILMPSIHGEAVRWRSLADSAIGLLAGGGLIYVTGAIGNWVFRKESMGGGDVKLLAMLGSFLGWQKVVLVFLLAPVLALPLGLFLKFVKRQEVVAFGPFLSLAGWMAFIWGERILSWYWRGMGF